MQLQGLAETGVKALEPLFEQERRAWMDHLQWDYRPALEMVSRFIDSGMLPGFALCGDIGPIGYTYFVADRPVAFIGGLYLADSEATRPAYRNLLDRAVRAIKSLSGIERIESQVFPFNMQLEPIFNELGFKAVRRYFMKVESPQASPSRATSGFRLCRWDEGRIRDSADVIFDSYRGAPDRELCRDYQSRGGCLRFLRNIVDNPACGIFDADNSLMAEDESHQLCGVLLTSRIQGDTGMVPQLSIRRKAQGQGLGTQLLSNYLLQAESSGIARVTLSVSEPNRRARRLYRKLGFETFREFHAFVWNG